MDKQMKKILPYTLALTVLVTNASPAFATPTPPITIDPITGVTTPSTPVVAPVAKTPAELIAELESKIQVIDSKIIEAMSKIDTLTADMNRGNLRVESSQIELEEAERRYNRARELSKERFQAIQENGGNKHSIFFDILLTSSGLTDFINKASAVNTIMQYDRQLSKELKQTADSLKDKKTKLDTELNAIITLKHQAELEKQVIDKEKANSLIELKRLEELQRQFLLNEAEEAKRKEAEVVKQEELARKALEALEAQQEEELRLIAEDRARQEQSIANAIENNLPVPTFTPLPYNIPSVDVSDVDSEVAKAVILEATKYLGTPYLWGGMTPEGFDCSGLLQYVYRSVGVELPRVSRDQQNFGTQIPLSDIQPGDLIFINVPATHVAMYIGNNQYLHAPRTGDVVKITTYIPKYWHTATRVLAK